MSSNYHLQSSSLCCLWHRGFHSHIRGSGQSEKPSAKSWALLSRVRTLPSVPAGRAGVEERERSCVGSVEPIDQPARLPGDQRKYGTRNAGVRQRVPGLAARFDTQRRPSLTVGQNRDSSWLTGEVPRAGTDAALWKATGQPHLIPRYWAQGSDSALPWSGRPALVRHFRRGPGSRAAFKTGRRALVRLCDAHEAVVGGLTAVAPVSSTRMRGQ